MKLSPMDGGTENAIVELGCRIPGNSGVPGTIEGIRVILDNGPAFLALTGGLGVHCLSLLIPEFF